MIICDSCGTHIGVRHLPMCRFVHDSESMIQTRLGRGVFRTKFKELHKEPSFSEWLANKMRRDPNYVPVFTPDSWGRTK